MTLITDRPGLVGGGGWFPYNTDRYARRERIKVLKETVLQQSLVKFGLFLRYNFFAHSPNEEKMSSSCSRRYLYENNTSGYPKWDRSLQLLSPSEKTTYYGSKPIIHRLLACVSFVFVSFTPLGASANDLRAHWAKRNKKFQEFGQGWRTKEKESLLG